VPELPASVDRHILNNRVIAALVVIREVSGSSLHEALDLFVERYEELRRDRPGDFTVAPEDYGRGFHS
jgi:hypothetical protein